MKGKVAMFFHKQQNKLDTNAGLEKLEVTYGRKAYLSYTANAITMNH